MKKINFSRRTLVFAFLTIALTAYVYLYEYKMPIEDAISQSLNQKLPNGLLPALDPGDVLILAEGEFWINCDWKILALK